MNKQIYREVFDFHSERLNALHPGLDFIADTVEKMQEIARKHPGDEFCGDMLRAVYGDLERRWDDMQST